MVRSPSGREDNLPLGRASTIKIPLPPLSTGGCRFRIPGQSEIRMLRIPVQTGICAVRYFFNRKSMLLIGIAL